MGFYNHIEAFCLMKYRDCRGFMEVLWNSRDGVTPFAVESRFTPGAKATHFDWGSDHRALYHVPSIGDRVFMDLSPERARARAVQRVEAYWDHGMSRHGRFAGMSREEAINWIANSFQPWEPDLVMVDQKLWEFFSQRASLAQMVGQI